MHLSEVNHQMTHVKYECNFISNANRITIFSKKKKKKTLINLYMNINYIKCVIKYAKLNY